MLRSFKALGLIDMRSVRRDSMLIGVALSPWLLVLFLRLMIPILTDWTGTQFEINLEDYYPLIAGVFIFLNVPLLIGVMSGFLLLDERDDDTLTAIRVTPASVKDLVFYRIITGFILSVVYILICTPLTGLIPFNKMLSIVPATLLASTFTPVVMLTLVGFARNKLEGFAVLKGVGFLVVGSVMAFFVTSQWQLLFGLIPTYWSIKAFWLALDNEGSRLYLLIGFIYNILLITLLYRRFRNQLQRA
jgi:fluoroquinolone transport system permease protein